MGGVGGVLEGENLQHDLLVCQPYNEVEEELANTGNADEFDEYEYVRSTEYERSMMMMMSTLEVPMSTH